MIEALHIIYEVKRLAVPAELGSEVRLRTVLGRVYYGIYHAISQHETLGPITKKFAADYRKKMKKNNTLKHLSVHKMMQEALISHSNSANRYIGKQLQTLFERRISADYKLSAPISINMAYDSIDVAEELLVEYLGMEF